MSTKISFPPKSFTGDMKPSQTGTILAAGYCGGSPVGAYHADDIAKLESDTVAAGIGFRCEIGAMWGAIASIIR